MTDKHPAINVRRPTSELDLPKPVANAPKAEERHRRPGTAAMLRQLGERLTPDGLVHVGSAVVHYYVRKLGPDGHAMVQLTDMTKVPEGLAVVGLQELGRELMTRYGHRPPRKLARAEARESSEGGA